VNLDGARASTSERVARGPWLPGLLPDLDLQSVELDRLEAFVRHPVRAFLRVRLGMSMADWTRDADDALPIDLDALEQWGVAERLLAARLAGATLDDCLAAERARGQLPPGELATPILARITPTLEELVVFGRSDLEPSSLDVNVVLPGAISLIGTVAHLRGDVLHTVSYSRVAPAHRLVAWARLLALTAAWPERSFEALTIGRARYGAARTAKITTAKIAALGGDAATRQAAALEHLDTLLDLFRRGMREPLPLYCRTSATWAEAAYLGRPAEKAAETAWTSGFKVPREDRDLEHELVLGGVVGFDRMLLEAGSPHDDETGDGWQDSELTRLGRLARRLWDGLLDHEELSDQ
jgi:exodeoxyribonuclease V gamma subunit